MAAAVDAAQATLRAGVMSTLGARPPVPDAQCIGGKGPNQGVRRHDGRYWCDHCWVGSAVPVQ